MQRQLWKARPGEQTPEAFHSVPWNVVFALVMCASDSRYFACRYWSVQAVSSDY